MFKRSTMGKGFLALALATFCGGGLAQAAPSYKVVKTVALGAPDRWDYLTFDPGSHRVYVAHGDRVTVVNGRSGKIVGEVAGFPGGTHGIAIVTAAGRGYSDDGKAGTASSFGLATLKRIKTIKSAPDADGILFDPASKHVFVINGDSGSVTVIDPARDAAIATIEGGGGLEFAVPDGHGKLYVDGAEKQEIVRIDTGTNQVDAHWPMPNCKRPHGIAIDPATHRLFSSCVNNVLDVVNTDTGALVAALPIGSYTDAAAFDPKRKLVFSSNGDGTLSIFAEKSPDSFIALPSVPTMLGARTMALDPDTGRIYLATANYTINAAATPSDVRHRYVVSPGSVKMLFLDPTP